MNAFPVNDELADLLIKLVDEELTQPDMLRLGELLRNEPAAAEFYDQFMTLHGLLVWQFAPPLPSIDSREPDANRFSANGKPTVAAVTSPSAGLGWLGGAWHSTVGFFSQEIPFACLIASVIMGVALTVCSRIYVTHHQQYARSFGTPDINSPYPTPLAPRPSPVARITGVLAVEWGTDEGLGIGNRGLEKGSGVRGQGSGTENPKVPKSQNPESRALIPESRVPSPQSLVIGDRLTLASGLVQLTYNSGAQVILQGPCTYEVNSPAGGFLSLGRLTARVDSGQQTVDSAKPPVDSAKPQASDIHHSSFSTHHSSLPSSLAPHPSPLFTIQTPTATITDLGTEFGVEVDKQGVCEVQVLQGRVRAEFCAAVGSPSQIVELVKGEGRRYLPTNDLLTLVTVDNKKFAEIRIHTPYQRWLEYSRQLRTDPALVAYYTFERHERGNWILPNQSAAGSVLDGLVEGAEWVDGRLPRKMALYFHGPGSGDRVVLPEQERFKFTGPFSAAVWFKVKQFTVECQTLIAKGDSSWRLHQDKYSKLLSFDTCREPFITPFYDVTTAPNKIDDGRWHLAVIVCEPTTEATAKKQIYIDGQLAAIGDAPLPLRQNNLAVWLGRNSEVPDSEFQGFIDEVAIFARALSPEEVITMYQAGVNH